MRKPTPLKLAIVASGRRQKDIAAQVGIDEATFSRIVNGLHVDDGRRRAISDALCRKPEELWPTPDQQAA